MTMFDVRAEENQAMFSFRSFMDGPTKPNLIISFVHCYCMYITNIFQLINEL